MDQKQVNGLVIVDTDVLIDASRGINDAILCLKQIEQQSALAISVITQMGLIIGCRDKTELQSLKQFLLRFQIIKWAGWISDFAIDLLEQYRLSHGLLIADGLIAATAISLSEPLVTKNQEDYRFVSSLNLLPYPHPFGTMTS